MQEWRLACKEYRIEEAADALIAFLDERPSRLYLKKVLIPIIAERAEADRRKQSGALYTPTIRTSTDRTVHIQPPTVSFIRGCWSAIITMCIAKRFWIIWESGGGFRKGSYEEFVENQHFLSNMASGLANVHNERFRLASYTDDTRTVYISIEEK